MNMASHLESLALGVKVQSHSVLIQIHREILFKWPLWNRKETSLHMNTYMYVYIHVMIQLCTVGPLQLYTTLPRRKVSLFQLNMSLARLFLTMYVSTHLLTVSELCSLHYSTV